MTDRIRFDANGARISKPGIDVNVATESQLILYPGMSSMSLAAQGTVTIPGGQRITVNFNNPNQRLPYVILGATDGTAPDRETFCAETSPPFNYMYIRNDVQSGAPAREITYAVLVDNLFI